MRGLSHRSIALTMLTAALGCTSRAPTPSAPPHDARGGFAPAHFDASKACGQWRDAVGSDGDAALVHTSFPELDPKACFVSIRYQNGEAITGPIPPGCGYPESTD